MSGVPIPAGLLYYSQLDSILRVEARPNEIRALIIARNELAHYMAKERSLDGGASEPAQFVTGSPDTGTGHDDELETFLPPTIDNPRECKKCHAVDSCMLYRKVSAQYRRYLFATHSQTVDRALASPDDPIAELYGEKTGHLTAKDAAFFRKWETLLTVEAQDMMRFRSQLWTMTSAQREKNGR